MIFSGNVCGLKIYVFIEEFDFKLKDNNRFIYLPVFLVDVDGVLRKLRVEQNNLLIVTQTTQKWQMPVLCIQNTLSDKVKNKQKVEPIILFQG